MDDTTNEPIPGATVVLSDDKGTPIKVNGNIVGRKADSQGYVTMPIAIDEMNAFIRVTSAAHETFVHWAKDYENQALYMVPKNNNLKAVVIKGKKPVSDIQTIVTNDDIDITPEKENKNWITWAIVGAAVLFTIIVVLLVKRKVKRK